MFWPLLVAAAAVLWVAGLRLFLSSGLSVRHRLIWSAVLVVAGAAIGALLSQDGISTRFLIALAIVLVLRSKRPWSFWLRACGFEICTVFGVAALVRKSVDVLNGN
jgi:hypothetical protein